MAKKEAATPLEVTFLGQDQTEGVGRAKRTTRLRQRVMNGYFFQEGRPVLVSSPFLVERLLRWSADMPEIWVVKEVSKPSKEQLESEATSKKQAEVKTEAGYKQGQLIRAMGKKEAMLGQMMNEEDGKWSDQQHAALEAEVAALKAEIEAYKDEEVYKTAYADAEAKVKAEYEKELNALKAELAAMEAPPAKKKTN